MMTRQLTEEAGLEVPGMIILEGCDGTGKSTLAMRLARDLDVEIWPRAATSLGGPIENLQQWTTRWLSDMAMRHDQLTLHDRTPLISDPIYGPVVRGHMSEGFDGPWYTDAWQTFIALQPMIVICMPPLEVVQANVQRDPDGQMPGVALSINALYYLYNNFLCRLRAYTHPRILLWDYTDKDQEEHYEYMTSTFRMMRYERKRMHG